MADPQMPIPDLAYVPKPPRQLTRQSVFEAHERITPYIHETPVITSRTLSTLASTPQAPSAMKGTEAEGWTPARPRIRLWFKCENMQKIGAFKARGAFHAMGRLLEAEREGKVQGLRKGGVVTHSSGNHAAALSLAATTHQIPAHIIMPTISTPSKIASTRSQGGQVHFSGSTAPERETVMRQVQAETGAVFVPPYDHPDVILGQGTAALEFATQVSAMLREEGAAGGGLDAVLAPCGGGGLLSGTATALQGTGIRVFGAEPSFQGADDCRRGLAECPPTRVEHVASLTIADGVRTPVGRIPWSVISDADKVRGVYAVTEEQIKGAMRLLMEWAKVVVEPSAVVGLAVVLYDESFRWRVQQEQGGDGEWNIGLILSGGNTTLAAISELFHTDKGNAEREEGVKGVNGERVAEDVAG